MGDSIIFEGKRFRKEDFTHIPSKEPDKKNKYRVAFYELWLQKEAERLGKSMTQIRSHETIEKFSSYFFKLYRERKKKNGVIGWDDFKDFEL